MDAVAPSVELPKGVRWVAAAVDERIYPAYTQQVNDDIYRRLGECVGFAWDAGNAPKVRRRHAVEPGECEQVFFGAPLLVSADLKHSQSEERWRALGVTLGGRGLHMVFTLRGATIRVLAARDMNRKERRDYEHAKARAEEDSGL